MNEIRYTEIDGKRYEVRACWECPFRDMGDGGYCAHCTYPTVDHPENRLWIEDDGILIQNGCPLREVQEPKETLKPCPFCGSTRIRDRYLDDDCEEIEKWMVEEANSYVNEDGGEPYNSIDEYREVNASYWQVYCPRCYVYVTSAKSMEDAWDKWNMRA